MIWWVLAWLVLSLVAALVLARVFGWAGKRQEPPPSAGEG